MEVINLNLIPTGALPVVHASQYDEGRTFRANLMDGSTVYTLDGTETLECDVKKPDGNIVTVAVTNTSDSYVKIDTTLQMCACAGESLAELHITKGAQEIGTLNFILAVERSPLEGGIESESEINNLATQVAGLVASEVENQYDSANVIFDNDPTTGHGVGYAVTSEGVKNAIDAITPAASSVSYDNTGSGMTATNVQDAIDELDTEVGSLSTLTTTDKSSLVGAVNEVNGAITSPKDITSDFITMASGYTFTSGKVYKQGKHIFGNIVLSGTLQGGNNSDTLGTIKSDYRTEEPINGFCGISNGQWFTNNIGYVYIASSGGLQVATTPTGMSYAKIHIDYVTA